MGDRLYIAKSEREMKLVTITKMVVEGLIKWNTIGFIGLSEYDRRFMKALLVACVGKKNIETGDMNDAGLVFAKGK